MKQLLILLRPHQWIKNIFVFAPMFFSLHLTKEAFILSFVAAVCFSMAASAVYILNDYHDIEEDREHPVKMKRPLASGSVSVTSAILLSALLMILSLGISYIQTPKLSFVIFFYLAMNFAYTYKLKHIAVIDISIIAVGFVLRIFAGAFAICMPASMWIIMVTFQLALFLALAKRRDDVRLAVEGKRTRKNIDGYNLVMINASMVFMAGVTVVSYIMYTISGEVTSRFGSEYLYLTSFFVIVGVMRYMQLTFVYNRSGSPTLLVYKDTFLKLTIIGWLASFITIVNL